MVTKTLPSTSDVFFELVDVGSMMLNWGRAPVHYYRRNRMPSPTYIASKADYISGIIRRKALPVFNSARARLLEVEEEAEVEG